MNDEVGLFLAFEIRGWVIEDVTETLEGDSAETLVVIDRQGGRWVDQDFSDVGRLTVRTFSGRGRLAMEGMGRGSRRVVDEIHHGVQGERGSSGLHQVPRAIGTLRASFVLFVV